MIQILPNHRKSTSLVYVSFCLTTLFVFSSGHAQAPDAPASFQNQQQTEESKLNLRLKTMGGTQFWTDVRVDGGWRVQQNSEFHHFRVLDENDVRQGWGTEQACQSILDKAIKSKQVRPYRGKVVILMHGLIRSGDSMYEMGQHLRANGYRVFDFRYASSRRPVRDHAAALKTVIERLNSYVTEISFVGHSLGNIVVRHYLADNSKAAPTSPGRIQQGDERIHRMVMLGPPNQGSRMARTLRNSMAFKVVTGASGTQLSEGWQQLEKSLATPNFAFGIIAGGQSDQARFGNFLLPGKDDFTVSVEETKLAGAHDFLVEPLVHSTMMKQPVALDATLNFLNHGYFRSPQQRNPIVK